MVICWRGIIYGKAEENFLYAYNQQPQKRDEAYLYVVPQRQQIRQPRSVVQKTVKKVKKKKLNPLVYLFRFTLVFSLFCSYVYFIYPTCFNNLIKNVFFPPKVTMNTKMPKGLAFKRVNNIGGADLNTIANPMLN